MQDKLKTFLVAVLAGGCSVVNAVEFTPSGRLHLAYAKHDSDRVQFDDRFLVRRAQLGFDVKFSHDWSAKFAYEFASGGSLKDGYLRYDGWKPAELSLGQFKVPFGLEELTSENDNSFVERSLLNSAFSLSRRKGIGLDNHGKKHSVAAMVFGASVGGNEGSGAAARVTYTPIKQGETLLHLGVSATTERPSGSVSFDARPESLPTDPRLLRTGKISDVRRIDQLGLEAAWVKGPVSMQAERMSSRLSRNLGKPDVDLQGWYVAGSWLLTGESRDYRDGVFKGVTPSNERGAWELTARLSKLDLDDGAIGGGIEKNLTLGVNWYFRDHLRIMANYIQVSSDRLGISDNPNILDLRAQLSF